MSAPQPMYHPQSTLGAPQRLKPAHEAYLRVLQALTPAQLVAAGDKEFVQILVMVNQVFDAWRNSPDISSAEFTQLFAADEVKRTVFVRPTSKGLLVEAQTRQGITISEAQKLRVVEEMVKRIERAHCYVVRAEPRYLQVFFRIKEEIPGRSEWLS